jgi:hypothetical protein
VRRLALAIIVALLAFSASGVLSLVTPEPCTATDACGDDRQGCAPTCATCGCCAQAAQIVTVSIPASPDRLVVTDVVATAPQFLDTDPAGILHVPKARRS